MNKKFLVPVLTTIVITLVLAPLLVSPAVAQDEEECWITLLDTTVYYSKAKESEWEGDTTRGPWSLNVPAVDGWIKSECIQLTDNAPAHVAHSGLYITYYDDSGGEKDYRKDTVNGGRLEVTHTHGHGGEIVFWRPEQEWQIKIKFIPAATIPDIIGLEQGEAEAILGQACLRVGEVSGDYQGTGLPEGSVYSTDPGAGNVLKAGSEVDIHLAGDNRPDCSFTVMPENPTADDPVICVSTSTDIDNDPLTCQWYLGGDSVGSGDSIELGELARGSYKIELVVDDGTLESRCSQTITVEASLTGGGGGDDGQADDNGKPDDGIQYGLGSPISKIKVTYLNNNGDEVSEEGMLVNPCNAASISLAHFDSHGNVTHTSTIATANLIRYDVISEIIDGQLYPGQFYIPFKPTSVITPNVDFTIQFVRDTPRPENIMFAGGTQVTANPDGMNQAGWYHYFVSGSNGTVGELSIIFTPGGGGGGGGMSCSGGGFGQPSQSSDMSLMLFGIVLLPLAISKCWRRMRK